MLAVNSLHEAGDDVCQQRIYWHVPDVGAVTIQ